MSCFILHPQTLFFCREMKVDDQKGIRQKFLDVWFRTPDGNRPRIFLDQLFGRKFVALPSESKNS